MTTPAATGQASYVRAGLSGLLLGLSFPPFPTYPLAWIALVPLLIGWSRAPSPQAMLREAFGAFLAAALVAFHWTLGHAFWIPAIASLGGLLLIALLMAMPFGAALPIRKRFGIPAGLIALASFSLTMEWLLHQGPWAFPWMLMGHTQAEAFPFNQMAAFAGVSGLSLWVWCLNIAGWMVLQMPHKRLAATAFVLLVAVPLFFGWSRTDQVSPPTGTTTAQFVQPAVPAPAWASLSDATRVDSLMALSASGDFDADAELVIWPETALPPHAPTTTNYVRQWAKRKDQSLLTGAIRPRSSESGVYFNSALLFQPDAPMQVYDKHHLVPFAEQVPFAQTFPFLQTLAVPSGGVRGYRSGTEWPLLRGDDFSLGALICFESAFSAPARRYAKAGADFLVTLAQDGWWGNVLGPRQHLAFTRLRAIETHRAVALVTVSGITTLIGPTGRSDVEIPWMQRATRIAHIPHFETQTVYTTCGPAVYWIALIVTGGWIVSSLYLRLKHNT